jgi:hypothetical protein
MREKKKGNLQRNISGKSPRNLNAINGILGMAFFGSLLLTIWEINIYRTTFIPIGLPLAIWVFAGLLLTPILSKFLAVYIRVTSLFWQLFYNVITFGGFAAFGFLWINCTFASNETQTLNEKIISVGHLAKGRGGCEQPYVVINYYGLEKELVYYCDVNVEEAKSVYLTTAKGFFGFDVIIKSSLNTN